MTKTLCGLLTPMLAITLTTGACGSGGPAFEGEARFADASDEDRGFAAATAVTGDLIIAFLVLGAEASSQAGCPTKATSGDDITYTADSCTNDEGDTYDGLLTVTNGQTDFFDGVPDPGAPTVMVFDGWSEIEGDNDSVLSLDGTMSFSNSLREIGTKSQRINDYTIEVEGVDDAGVERSTAVKLDTAAECEVIGETQTDCQFLAGSTGAVDGVGGFSIDGSFSFADNEFSGELTLRGADTLVVTLGECLEFTLDGQPAGEFCGGAE